MSIMMRYLVTETDIKAAARRLQTSNFKIRIPYPRREYARAVRRVVGRGGCIDVCRAEDGGRRRSARSHERCGRGSWGADANRRGRACVECRRGERGAKLVVFRRRGCGAVWSADRSQEAQRHPDPSQ
eukprot:1360217-Rhodomonas_salina.1